MRLQPNCFELVLLLLLLLSLLSLLMLSLMLILLFRVTLKVDLMLLSMEVEFPGGWCGANSNNRVKPNSVELSLGCVEVELGL